MCTDATAPGKLAALMRLSIFDFSGWPFALLRRLLFVWVRTRVMPEPEHRSPDGARPVCYVIQDRRLTNVLVLMKETERAGPAGNSRSLAVGSHRFARNFFCLTRAQPLLAPARRRYGHSAMLARLTGIVRADSALDVDLVPVTILWGRAPQNQDSILRALFAESWRPPGHLRQLMAVLLHGRDVLVRFGDPVSLASLVRSETDPARAMRKVSRVLRVHFRRQRAVAIGPDVSHRNTQVERLLAAPAVRAAMQAEMAAKNVDAFTVERQARRYVLEIASDYSYGVIRAFELFLTWLWTRLYDGVKVHHIETLLEAAPGREVVYIPCHRSHIDYLLLSYVVYKRGLSVPHIAAGANLNLPVVGPLLRRAGAFFLRRSFKGDPLYAAVFNEYLHLMLSRGFPIEYFIEGTRSRSGRSLMPREGILGMTLRSYLRSHERPLVFVPVYFGYEKLIEGPSFLNELAGRPKSGESLWGLVGTLRKLKHVFGHVHVNFGRPLLLAEFLDRHRPGWDTEPAQIREGWLREATAAAAIELVRRINEAAVVTPINLLALALLATPKHAIDEETLYRLLAHYQALLREVPYGSVAISCEEPADAIIAQAIRLGVLERIEHPLGDLFRVPAGQAPLLAYFRNNVLHLVVLPALLACLMAHNPRLSKVRVAAAIDRLYVLARAELFLRCEPEQVSAALAAVLTALSGRGLIFDGGDEWAAPDPSSREFAELHLLGETVRPILERYFLTLALLRHHGSGRLDRKGLEESSHLLAQRLSLLYEFNGPEFSERGLFAGLIATLLAADILREDERGLLQFDQRISAPAADAELLLTAEVRQAIQRLACAQTLPPLSEKPTRPEI